MSEQIAERRLPLRLLDPPALDLACLPSPRQEGAIPLATGPVPRESLYRGWARSSYTSWTHGRARDEGPRLPAEAVEEGRDTSDPEPEEGTVLEARPPTPEAMAWPDLGPWADLPRGSGFGECLHRVLEQIDYGSPLPSPALQTVVTHELRRAGLDERWAPPLLDAIPQMLSTPFGGELGGLRPADLHAQARMNELHFDLSLHHVRAADLARAFGDHPGGAFGEAYAAALSQLPVNHCGFLTGSIDLIFPDPATERWWVLDWKSNWLGRRDGQGRTLSCGPGDYGTEVLQSLMASHHYPLQAHLYLVALHRYLAWRLPSYGPEQHLGGYAYVFVRGTPGASGPGVQPRPRPGRGVVRPPPVRGVGRDRGRGPAP
ncbi:MAG: PD-(D/E)XK nuclease family protein, partial [Cyanobium sp.]